MRRFSIPAFLLILSSLAHAEAAAPEKRPELQVGIKGDKPHVGWAADDGFEFESSLGKYTVKWALVAWVAIDADGKATLTMADKTTLTGKVLDEKVRIRKEGGTERTFPWSGLTGLSVRMVAVPTGDDPARELGHFPEVFGCAGIVACPGGIVAAADRTTPRVLFLDSATLKQSAVLKLEQEPRALVLTPAGKLVISANNAVIWADPATGAVVKSVPTGFSGHWLVAPTDDEAIVSDGRQIAVVSAKKEKVLFQEQAGYKVSVAPSAACVLSGGGRLHFDPGADGVKRPVLCPMPWDPVRQDYSFASSSGFLVDRKFLITENGAAYRLCVGAGPPLVKVATLPPHLSGTAIRGGKAMVLFDNKKRMFIVESGTWKCVRHAAVELDVFAVAAVDDNSVVVLSVPVPVSKPFGPEEYFTKSGPDPSSLVKVSLEE